jgi:hypothetical protein
MNDTMERVLIVIGLMAIVMVVGPAIIWLAWSPWPMWLFKIFPITLVAYVAFWAGRLWEYNRESL